MNEQLQPVASGRRRRRSATSFLLLSLGLTVMLAAPTGAGRAAEMHVLHMDADWIRRDDTGCAGGSGMIATEHSLSVWSDSSAVLYWQIPVLNSAPFAVKGRPHWRRRCERPPVTFWQTLRDADAEGQVTLVEAHRLPMLSWRWHIAEEQLADSAKGAMIGIGVTLQKRGTTQIRELAYVWYRDEVEGSWTTEERTVIPGIFKIRNARVVVRSGAPQPQWFTEERSLDEDMNRFFGERAGKVLRVLVKVYGEPSRTYIRAGFGGFHLAPADAAAANGP